MRLQVEEKGVALSVVLEESEGKALPCDLSVYVICYLST